MRARLPRAGEASRTARRPRPPAVHPALALQRTAGNAAVRSMLQRDDAGPAAGTGTDAAAGDAGAADQAPAELSIGAIWTAVTALVTPPSPPADAAAAVIALEQKLAARLKQDPLNPPKWVRDGLAASRHWVMEAIAKVMAAPPTTPAAPQQDLGVTVDPKNDPQPTGAATMAIVAPLIDVLEQGDPQFRYEHFDPAVQSAVLAAIELRASRRGLGQIGSADTAHAEAKDADKAVGDQDWCGAFVDLELIKAGQLDQAFGRYLTGVGMIPGIFSYAYPKQWIWVFDHWEDQQSYQQNTRQAGRHYAELDRSAPSFGIEPGDVVMIDNHGQPNPDHIVMVASFDGDNLRTIGGNEGSTNADNVKLSGNFTLSTNPRPNTGTGDKGKTDKNLRLFSIGRFSIVDFEQHVYRPATDAKPPTAPPSEKALKDAGLA